MFTFISVEVLLLTMVVMALEMRYWCCRVGLIEALPLPECIWLWTKVFSE